MKKGFYHHSEKTKRIMSIIKTGKKRKPFTEKTRKKMSLSKMGTDNPSKRPEVREKIKIKATGRRNLKHSTWMKKNNPMKSEKAKHKVSMHMKENNPAKRVDVRDKLKKIIRERGINEKTRKRMLKGGAAHANSFNRNPSKPQVKLFNLVRELYEGAILNNPCLNYSIDIAIPSLMVAIEYDGSYYHQDTEKDKKRQQEIENQGWKFIRYRDCIPDKERLIEDIKGGINL
ncbi:hypothetical protein A2Z67_06030 [Candidatus Woesebacteria bacterium RBG_13_36_22]|uniref:DUF559 domain-containing protein n=1 Tax=Candidatus Woesebacteria bacterium RBG_13_36_22 TaxID=1802478 RepID=A0A1F7X028_9BACT|nr:MAG: hypothetical protein A2Z67_06030 [Candidatus Woesebacteria bacterium RBG_13_36_22]